jgi:pimeloyl-ACP methyl ester carboxylesterase
MAELEVQRLRAGDVEIAYQTLGDPADPPVVLVMGLGTQMHYWPDGFCRELADRSLYVIRFDNRDSGLSTHFHAAGPVDLTALSPPTSLPYTLGDMAADVTGLIEALGLDGAHLVGISMGGMVSQAAAIATPARVRSLVSIASTTGDPQVGQATPAALEALFATPAQPTRDAVADTALSVARAIGSPGFPLDEAWVRWRAEVAFDRCYDPAGVTRQAAAIVTAPDRTAALAGLALPALVVHGAADPLIDVSGGRATAAAIAGCELMVIDGMGHDLPREVWPRVADGVTRTVRRAVAP